MIGERMIVSYFYTRSGECVTYPAMGAPTGRVDWGYAVSLGRETIFAPKVASAAHALKVARGLALPNPVDPYTCDACGE